MFSGRFDHAIDDKGRVSIPARFREKLELEGNDRLFITNSRFEGKRCLDLYPPAEWSQLLEKVSGRPRFDDAVRHFEMFYIAGAFEVPVDKQGRILIPPKLREYAALGREITFSASTDRFQLWDKATLEEVLAVAEKQFDDPQFFNKLGL